MLLVDAGTFQPRAQCGQTDVAGTGGDALDQPTAVAIADRRAVVYDSGNQRIVKLQISQ